MSIENHPNFFAVKFIVEFVSMMYEGLDEEKLGKVYRECMRHQLAKESCPSFHDIMTVYGEDIRKLSEEFDSLGDNDEIVHLVSKIEDHVDRAIRKTQNER